MFLYLRSTGIRDFFEVPNSAEQLQQRYLEEIVKLQERHPEGQRILIFPWFLARAFRFNKLKERQVTVCSHRKQLFNALLFIFLRSGRLVLQHVQDKRPQRLEEN